MWDFLFCTNSINVKEQSEFIKDKLREEIKNTLKKDEILTKEDAILIKKFYLKILSEINRVN